MIVRQDHCIDIDDIGCCAFAGTGNRRHSLNSAISESCNWQGERSDLIFGAEA